MWNSFCSRCGIRIQLYFLPEAHSLVQQISGIFPPDMLELLELETYALETCSLILFASPFSNSSHTP